MFFKKKEPKDTTGDTVGGFAFYLSLFVLMTCGTIIAIIAISTFKADYGKVTGTFGLGALVGAFIAHTMVRGHLSVLIHEFKHSVVSNLAGNKRRGMVVDSDSGHFEYSYTKDTAHLNAFISLAPYCLPLMTFLFGLAAFALFYQDHMWAAGLVGVGYGADVVMNVRDISPVQTDISLIRGGYGVGLTYIFFFNLSVFGALLMWVFQGGEGLLLLAQEFAETFVRLHGWLNGLGREVVEEEVIN